MCDIIGCGHQRKMPPINVDSERRRLFLKGMASLPLATVLAFPELSRAAASRLEDVSITLDDGATVTGALALPDTDKAPTVVLIHEWWGLNDQIKSVAAELANMGYVALAVNLYEQPPATDREGAMALMKALDADRATETMRAWVTWLRDHEHGNSKVATMGWCFGGGWSLNTSIATPVDATIIYYGRVNRNAEDLANLAGPVLGHFGELDKNINREMVSAFEAEMAKAGRKDLLTLHWYDADHAFANPTGSRYDAEDAALAWERSTAFLEQHLK